ncbi:hypothetical protein [Burkholderia ubonensis]|uniref:Uncharacterized protein n=1 Tax=Burkholderia ubonensis TaxID=101571 RepID=A0A1R1J744_9BURK|nr:hypothetical protein [Burkholderia ubonensis]OMG71123.1 hypothetical protein BW685_22130 [Burkholderia ubonensis]
MPTDVTRYERDVGDWLLAVERTLTDAGVALGIEPDAMRFEYDKGGRLIAEHGVNGTVGYALDKLDNVSALSLPHEQPPQTLRYGSGHVYQLCQVLN